MKTCLFTLLFVSIAAVAGGTAPASMSTPAPSAATAMPAQCPSLYKAKNFSAAHAACTAAAEQGDGEARYTLGRMYEEGQGVPKDPAGAVKWDRRGAEVGHAASQRPV